MSLFDKLRQSLDKTRTGFVARLESVLLGKTISEELYEEIEDLLVAHDVGVAATERIVQQLRQLVRVKRITEGKHLKGLIADIVADSFGPSEPLRMEAGTLNIYLVVGVNGAGKTTTIGKLAWRFREQGVKVMVAAGDTFRAAASSQLEIWAERAKVPLVSHADGADPAAVVYDAIHAARARGIELLIIDTAGRLHNKSNLMQELAKMRRIIEREAAGSLKEALLVVDATTGQNALIQAREFGAIVPLSGIVLTKLDGTAKGGIILAINQEQQIPIKLIGVGEQLGDLRDFNALEFAEALFQE